eukprot:3131923-Pleurochrysis_carterae.AAC.1
MTSCVWLSIQSDASRIWCIPVESGLRAAQVEVVRSSAQSGMGLHVREKEIVKAEWDEQNRELEQSERKIEQLESILRSRTADLQAQYARNAQT